MRKNCGSIVEKCCVVIRNIFERFSLCAYAEEPNNDDGSDEGGGEDDSSKKEPSKKSVVNYEDLIAKARKEEKEKQYKTIEKLKGQVETLTEQHNNDLLVVAGLKEDLAKAETKLSAVGKDDSETVKTLKAEIEGLTKDKKSLEKQIEDLNKDTVKREEVEAEIRAELEAEYEVKTYKATKLAELKDDLLVPELVFGNTKEEIDNSIKSALERSAEIKKSLGVSESGKKRTPKSPANPSVGGVQDKGISIEYLASLDVASPEYAQVRKQLGLK